MMERLPPNRLGERLKELRMGLGSRSEDWLTLPASRSRTLRRLNRGKWIFRPGTSCTRSLKRSTRRLRTY